jgi:hypothetical protein
MSIQYFIRLIDVTTNGEITFRIFVLHISDISSTAAPFFLHKPEKLKNYLSTTLLLIRSMYHIPSRHFGRHFAVEKPYLHPLEAGKESRTGLWLFSLIIMLMTQ